jgi:adenylosuccinate synthase
LSQIVFSEATLFQRDIIPRSLVWWAGESDIKVSEHSNVLLKVYSRDEQRRCKKKLTQGITATGTGIGDADC